MHHSIKSVLTSPLLRRLLPYTTPAARRPGLKHAAIAFVFALAAPTPVRAEPSLPTPGEASHYTRYTQNDDIAQFLSQLDHAADELAVRVVGRSGETTTFDARDLYLAVLTREGAAHPGALDRNKPTVFLFASQHGDEQSAKEAALVLIRDLAAGELRALLDEVNVLVMPQVNPWGNHVDLRRNEQDLDLNRDHVKLEAPQTEAIHRVFRQWMPEVTVDSHEKGDDYYRISYGCVSNLNVHPELQAYSREVILQDIATSLEEAGITFHEYLITETMGVDSAAGAALPEDAGENQPTMKRYSTTDLNDGRNSLGIYQTLSFILEGSSRHDLESLAERTRWQVHAMRAMIESAARHGEEIVELVQHRRIELLGNAADFSADDLVHLRMEYTRSESEPKLTIHRFEETGDPVLGILTHTRAAGEAVRESDLEPWPHDAHAAVVEEVVENWFPDVHQTVSVSRPLAYVVPAGHPDVIETLLRHRIEVESFVADMDLAVEEYTITHVVPAEYDYIAPPEIEVDKRTVQRRIEAGSFLVRTSQPAANLIPALLEPMSAYGLIRYQDYALVPGAGEVFPFLRLIRLPSLPVVPYKPWRGEARKKGSEPFLMQGGGRDSSAGSKGL